MYNTFKITMLLKTVLFLLYFLIIIYFWIFFKKILVKLKHIHLLILMSMYNVYNFQFTSQQISIRYTFQTFSYGHFEAIIIFFKISYKAMWNADLIFKHGYLMKIPIESLKKTEYSINIYGGLDVPLFPKKIMRIYLIK